jgi:hypothetical protein
MKSFCIFFLFLIFVLSCFINIISAAKPSMFTVNVSETYQMMNSKKYILYNYTVVGAQASRLKQYIYQQFGLRVLISQTHLLLLC